MIPIALLIPAYNPLPALIELVNHAINNNIRHIVVVNDGSQNPESLLIFESLRANPRVTLLDHVTNLGKGAALKTGLNHIALYFKDAIGAVTADADGQHVIEDILKVSGALANEPTHLILGVRSFEEGVPLRSKIGNVVTRWVFRLMTGLTITDTQTGLRGIGMVNIPIYLKIPTNRYEYEMDMLLISNTKGIKITEIPIQTIYLDDNRSSHFSPFIDSMRIYFVFIRFLMSSVITAIIDFIVFTVSLLFFDRILPSQVASRSIAGVFNYYMNKVGVFGVSSTDKLCWLKYISLVAVMGCISHVLILYFTNYFTIPVLAAKLLAEGLLFLASFTIQRDFVFASESERL